MRGRLRPEAWVAGNNTPLGGVCSGRALVFKHTYMLYAAARYAAVANRSLARDVCSGLCALPLVLEPFLHTNPMFASYFHCAKQGATPCSSVMEGCHKREAHVMTSISS